LKLFFRACFFVVVFELLIAPEGIEIK